MLNFRVYGNVIALWKKGVHGGHYATLVSTKYTRAGHQKLELPYKKHPHMVGLMLRKNHRIREKLPRKQIQDIRCMIERKKYLKQMQDITGERIYVEYLPSWLSCLSGNNV